MANVQRKNLGTFSCTHATTKLMYLESVLAVIVSNFTWWRMMSFPKKEKSKRLPVIIFNHENTWIIFSKQNVRESVIELWLKSWIATWSLCCQYVWLNRLDWPSFAACFRVVAQSQRNVSVVSNWNVWNLNTRLLAENNILEDICVVDIVLIKHWREK